MLAFTSIHEPVSEDSEATWQCQIKNLKVEELFPSPRKLPKASAYKKEWNIRQRIDFKSDSKQIKKEHVNGESRVSFL